ncbi:hypothetical protein [Aliikangiella coralliicola]|uniref:Uncharacterized protein n=1 Tax=Aliikangiella coralliicola TaxID=2592383 RepID=A0A545UHA7_9GAMM|nr:hypothetical protein [Aliikangiella coralliicola]TQV88845.1 hypothetical protein FLL46_04745 [Aliikangiella coralliicola]
MTQAHFAIFDLNAPLERVRVPLDLCNLLIERFLAEEKPSLYSKENTQFNILRLEENDPTRAQVDEVFSEFEINAVRIHEFQPHHQATPHFDSAFNGYKTLIIRLDDNGKSRLKIEGELVPEHQGLGFRLPSGTLHEIINGDHIRYSLTIWGKQKLG